MPRMFDVVLVVALAGGAAYALRGTDADRWVIEAGARLVRAAGETAGPAAQAPVAAIATPEAGRAPGAPNGAASTTADAPLRRPPTRNVAELPPPAPIATPAPFSHGRPIAPVPPDGLAAASSQDTEADARTRLARTIQAELRRVGCYAGEVDGAWGPDTQRAMTAFNQRVNATLPTGQPDYILLTLLQGHAAQACAASCASGQQSPRGVACPTPEGSGDQRRAAASVSTDAAASGWAQALAEAATGPAPRSYVAPPSTRQASVDSAEQSRQAAIDEARRIAAANSAARNREAEAQAREARRQIEAARLAERKAAAQKALAEAARARADSERSRLAGEEERKRQRHVEQQARIEAERLARVAAAEKARLDAEAGRRAAEAERARLAAEGRRAAEIAALAARGGHSGSHYAPSSAGLALAPAAGSPASPPDSKPTVAHRSAALATGSPLAPSMLGAPAEPQHQTDASAAAGVRAAPVPDATSPATHVAQELPTRDGKRFVARFVPPPPYHVGRLPRPEQRPHQRSAPQPRTPVKVYSEGRRRESVQAVFKRLDHLAP